MGDDKIALRNLSLGSRRGAWRLKAKAGELIELGPDLTDGFTYHSGRRVK
jgi:hypothetical protein